MKKFFLSILVVFGLSFIIVLIVLATRQREYMTQVVFVPDTDETSLRNAALQGDMDILLSIKETFDKAIDEALKPDMTESRKIWEDYDRKKDYAETGVKKTTEQYRAEILQRKVSSLLQKIDKCTFNLNALSREGWEIKTSRRAWVDFNDNTEVDSYEWGTEYALQKKKSFW